MLYLAKPSAMTKFLLSWDPKRMAVLTAKSCLSDSLMTTSDFVPLIWSQSSFKLAAVFFFDFISPKLRMHLQSALVFWSIKVRSGFRFAWWPPSTFVLYLAVQRWRGAPDPKASPQILATTLIKPPNWPSRWGVNASRLGQSRQVSLSVLKMPSSLRWFSVFLTCHQYYKKPEGSLALTSMECCWSTWAYIARGKGSWWKLKNISSESTCFHNHDLDHLPCIPLSVIICAATDLLTNLS